MAPVGFRRHLVIAYEPYGAESAEPQTKSLILQLPSPRHNRANYRKREDPHILYKVDKPRPPQTARFQHGFAQPPAEKPRHQHADHAIRDAIKVTDSKGIRHQPKRLMLPHYIFQYR